VKQQPITFRTVDQMTRKDRDLVADAESSISERAGFIGLEFNGGKWSYEQFCARLCRITFCCASPATTDGRREHFFGIDSTQWGRPGSYCPNSPQGYSLFSPAPINALTISAFNHIRAEEHADTPPQWLGTALCYAALAGGHPESPLTAEADANQKFQLAMPAKMEIPARGNVALSFAEHLQLRGQWSGR